jgi:hypothetical protein
MLQCSHTALVLSGPSRSSATINWNLKDNVRAAMRSRVRRLLGRFDHPPDREERAIELEGDAA